MRRFAIYYPEYLGDEPDYIEAYDAGSAAEYWAEEMETRSAEYPLLEGETIELEVEDEDGVRARFRVSGYTRAVYSATQIS